MKEYRVRGCNASYTVEAALIFPLILMLVIFFIYLTGFLYNRAMLMEYAYMAAMEGANFPEKSNEEIREIAEKKAQSLLDNQLLFTKSTEITTSVNYNSVTVAYDVEMDVPTVFLAEGFIREDYFQIHVSQSTARRRQVMFLRMCKKLAGLTEIAGDYDDTQEDNAEIQEDIPEDEF